MTDFGRSWSFFGICICFIAVLVGPFITHADYNWVRHTTGQMAGQQMPNAWLVRAGYVSLGFGVFLDSVSFLGKERLEYLSFIVLGLCMIGAGAFNLRSIDVTGFMAAPFEYWHGFLFIGSGVSLVIGVALRAHRLEDGYERTIAWAVVGFVGSALPAIFLFPPLAGVFERIALFVGFIWLALFLRPSGSAAS